MTSSARAADAVPALDDAPASPPARTCRCGHDRGHPLVSPNPTYSFVGWVAILTGISWEPRNITFVCRRCGETFDRIDDPAEIKKVKLFG